MSNNPLALVIGGSRGIGSAIALRLAHSGFNLWITYRSDDAAAAGIQAQVQAAGRSCELMRFDIADYEATQAALAARAQETPPDAVVFNAGIVKPRNVG